MRSNLLTTSLPTFLNNKNSQKWRGVINGLKSYNNDAYPRYFLDYWPKPKKALFMPSQTSYQGYRRAILWQWITQKSKINVGPSNIIVAGFCLFQLQRCCDGSDWKIFSKKQKHAAVKVIFSSCKSLQCSGSSTMQISSHLFISIFPFNNNPICLIFLFKLEWVF